MGGLNSELVATRETMQTISKRVNDTNDVHMVREDVREIRMTIEKNIESVSLNNKAIQANTRIVTSLC